MTDLIKRAEAIDAVMAEGRNVYTSEYANAERVIYEADAVEALSMLPSAEATCATCADRALCIMSAPDGNWKACKDYRPAEAVQGWIPCEERLPKPWESVMTTIRWVGDEYEDDYDIAVGFKKISGDWDLTLADGTGVIKGFLVQAWMPLPTPYKGGEDE